MLTRRGHPPKTIETTATAHIARTSDGFEIPRIELATTAVVDGIDAATFQELATQAKDSCPLSKALRAFPISLSATLAA